MSALDILDSERKRSRRGCRRCGGTVEARVSIEVRESSHGKPPGKTRVSRSANVCGSCAVAVWDHLIREFEDQVKT